MKRQLRTFSVEFKLEVAWLLIDQGYSAQEASHSPTPSVWLLIQFKDSIAIIRYEDLVADPRYF